MSSNSGAQKVGASAIPELRDEFADAPEALHPDARALLEYWRARIADGGFVVGRDIPARPIARLLRNVAVYEPLADGTDLKVRLAGDAIRTRFGKVVKGRLMSELFPREDFERHLAGSIEALRSGRPRIVDSRLMREQVLELHLEVLVLPVTAPDLVSTWLLVGLFYFDEAPAGR